MSQTSRMLGDRWTCWRFFREHQKWSSIRVTWTLTVTECEMVQKPKVTFGLKSLTHQNESSFTAHKGLGVVCSLVQRTTWQLVSHIFPPESLLVQVCLSIQFCLPNFPQYLFNNPRPTTMTGLDLCVKLFRHLECQRYTQNKIREGLQLASLWAQFSLQISCDATIIWCLLHPAQSMCPRGQSFSIADQTHFLIKQCCGNWIFDFFLHPSHLWILSWWSEEATDSLKAFLDHLAVWIPGEWREPGMSALCQQRVQMQCGFTAARWKLLSLRLASVWLQSLSSAEKELEQKQNQPKSFRFFLCWVPWFGERTCSHTDAITQIKAWQWQNLFVRHMNEKRHSQGNFNSMTTIIIKSFSEIWRCDHWAQLPGRKDQSSKLSDVVRMSPSDPRVHIVGAGRPCDSLPNWNFNLVVHSLT